LGATTSVTIDADNSEIARIGRGCGGRTRHSSLMRAGPFPAEVPRGGGRRGRTRTCDDRIQNPAPWPAWRRAPHLVCNLVLPAGVQPAKSGIESAVPLAPGDGRLARAAGIEPDTSCLVDRHAAHYATPAGMNDGGEYRDRTCASVRTRRVSTALPCRSANSPVQMARSTGLEPAWGRLEHG
jgi:hypothetical protein